MIPVDVTNVGFFNQAGFFVFLKERKGERALPVFIGPLEAHSIASQINNEPSPRPMTHDLLKSALDALGASIEKIEIHDLVESVFLGNVHLKSAGGEKFVLDSRPSDAIAIALRFAAPIFVAEHVMEKAGVVVQNKQQEGAPIEEQDQHIELTPLERLKADLDLAIKEERYEDAARLRDEIKTLSSQTGNN